MSPGPHDYGGQLKSVFLHWFRPIMLLLLYHGCIRVISPCGLNNKPSHVSENMFDFAKLTLRDVEEIFYLASEKFDISNCRVIAWSINE